jgi:hypothetical protein
MTVTANHGQATEDEVKGKRGCTYYHSLWDSANRGMHGKMARDLAMHKGSLCLGRGISFHVELWVVDGLN